MSVLHESKRLKKELSLFNVYALATGATLSSGFFLLPGLAAAYSGPAVTVSYLIAALHLVPAVFCMAELSTAMPRAGGIYYFLDRSMGPLMGTIGGLGTWLALILKTAFALVGMGAYLSLFLPNLPLIPVVIALAILFGGVNLFGAKKSGGFQVVLVIGLLGILTLFFLDGLLSLQRKFFENYLASGFESIYATSGLVYISYVGLTNIASVSEEVDNPERNLPLGMMLALVSAILIYGIGTMVMVGVLSPEELHYNLTPVASVAERLAGKTGAVIMTVAAVLAFFSVSNAAILSASRYPLAMSRDHLLPRFFRLLSRYRTPKVSICVTVLFIAACLVFLDPTRIAKLASAFQLLLFSLSCLAVIIMRESKLASYDPGYRSPFYPVLPAVGFLAPLILITEMGIGSILFTGGLVLLGCGWYYGYARKRVQRDGAIYHLFARLGERQDPNLDRELRGILQEKGLRQEDPFDMMVARAGWVDLEGAGSFHDVVDRAADKLINRVGVSRRTLRESFLEGTRVGATPVSHGVALPHMRLPDLPEPLLVIVRVRSGVTVEIDDEHLKDHVSAKPVYAFFFLVSPEDNPSRHLRLLAQLAEHAQEEGFLNRWLLAKDEHHIKSILHRDEHFLMLTLTRRSATKPLIGHKIRDLSVPDGCLIAIVHRGGEIIIPKGKTILQDGDMLTIIGDPHGIHELRQSYLDPPKLV